MRRLCDVIRAPDARDSIFICTKRRYSCLKGGGGESLPPKSHKQEKEKAFYEKHSINIPAAKLQGEPDGTALHMGRQPNAEPVFFPLAQRSPVTPGRGGFAFLPSTGLM